MWGIFVLPGAVAAGFRFLCEHSPNMCIFKQRRQIIGLACDFVCLELIKKPRRRWDVCVVLEPTKVFEFGKLGDGAEQTKHKMRFSFCQTLLITSTRKKKKSRVSRIEFLVFTSFRSLSSRCESHNRDVGMKFD